MRVLALVAAPWSWRRSAPAWRLPISLFFCGAGRVGRGKLIDRPLEIFRTERAQFAGHIVNRHETTSLLLPPRRGGVPRDLSPAFGGQGLRASGSALSREFLAHLAEQPLSLFFR